MDVVKKIEAVGTPEGKPEELIRIVDSGELKEEVAAPTAAPETAPAAEKEKEL